MILYSYSLTVGVQNTSEKSETCEIAFCNLPTLS